DGYFGAGEPHKDDEAISDFTIHVPQETLVDMKNRIREGLARIPSSLEGTNNFSLGFNPRYLRNLSESMLTFDWRQHERFLNSFEQKTTEIEGLRIHFLHVSYPEQKGEKRYPLLLIHGYPSSFWDFYKIIPMLGNPSRFGFDFGAKGRISFDVVVPSIPGFGWSDKPAKPGFSTAACARIFAKLMDRLGYAKLFIHGSSAIGSEIASIIAASRPNVVSGLHLGSPWIRLGMPAWPLHFRDYFAITWTDGKLMAARRALALLQASDDSSVKRPDTYGIMAGQSPLALTALLLDRWAAGSSLDYQAHPQGELQSHLTVDELLTQVHVYWLTDSITHALRFLHNSEEHALKREFDR
ncbi:Protein C45B11.6, partial [Aphelenchoides avenae]